MRNVKLWKVFLSLEVVMERRFVRRFFFVKLDENLYNEELLFEFLGVEEYLKIFACIQFRYKGLVQICENLNFS